MTKQSFHRIDSNSPYNIFISYLTHEMLNNIVIALTINYIFVNQYNLLTTLVYLQQHILQ